MSQTTRVGQSVAACSIQRLPFELFQCIASNVDQPSLARLSLASRTFQAAAYPELFRTLRLVQEEEGSEEERARLTEEDLWRRGRLARCVKVLSKGKDLCEMVKHIELGNLWWIGSDEWPGLELVLIQSNAQSLVIDFADPASFRLDDPANREYQALWETVERMPRLKSIDFHHPGGFDINLQANPVIHRVRLSDSTVCSTDGPLSSLTHLILHDVFGLTTSWFPPELFYTLEFFCLSHPATADVNAIAASLKRFTSQPTTLAPLRTFALSLSTRPDLQVSVNTVRNFLASFEPATFPSLASLQLRWLPEGYFARPQQGVPTLSALFPYLRACTVLLLGEDHHDLEYELDGPASLQPFSGLSELEFLTVGYQRLLPVDSFKILKTFQTFPKLLYFAVRDSSSNQDGNLGGSAWIVDTTDDDSISEGPVSTPVKPLSHEPYGEEPVHRLGDDLGMEWYRETVRKLHSG